MCGRFFYLICTIALLPTALEAQAFRIDRFNRAGLLSWTNSFPIGVCTLETAPLSAGAWKPEQNFFTTTNAGQVAVTIGPDQRFFRLLSVDISPNSAGFNNLLASYGVLNTIA